MLLGGGGRGRGARLGEGVAPFAAALTFAVFRRVRRERGVGWFLVEVGAGVRTGSQGGGDGLQEAHGRVHWVGGQRGRHRRGAVS